MNSKLSDHQILVADDNHSSRDLLRGMLSRICDAKLHFVGDGAAALEAYRTLRPQILLLDVDMPKLDGFEVLDQVRAIDADAFVVMVSAHNGIEVVQKAVKHGVGGYIVKPYSIQRVVDALNRYVTKMEQSRLAQKT